MNEPWGLNLRAERELRGITLESLSKATNISVRHLELFETNRFDNLPRGLFLKTCIRAYIDHLGLDPDKVYLEFEYLNLLREKNSDRELETGNNRDSLAEMKIPVLGFIIISSILLMWWVPRFESADVAGSHATAPIMESNELPFLLTETEARLKYWSEQDLTLDGPESDSTHIPSIKVPDGLLISTRETTWIRIRKSDGQDVLQALFPGDRKYLPVTGRIRISAEKPEALKIINNYDGTPLNGIITPVMDFIPGG